MEKDFSNLALHQVIVSRTMSSYQVRFHTCIHIGEIFKFEFRNRFLNALSK